MKSNHNPQLDDILINLMSCTYHKQPNWQEAMKYRELHSATGSQSKKNIKKINRFLNQKNFKNMELDLLSILISFTVQLLHLLLLCNLRGNGLDVYGYQGFTKVIMRVSLANQNNYDISQISQSPNIITDMKANQNIIIFFDILSTIILIVFLIYWQIKSDILIYQLLSQNVLPSAYTLVVQGLPPVNYCQQNLKQYFSKFGKIAQISTVYDYKNLLIYIDQFISMAQQFTTVDKDQKIKVYQKLQIKLQQIKQLYYKIHQMKPICAFITYDDLHVRNNVRKLYHLRSQSQTFLYHGYQLQIRRCYTQPLSIIWENFNLTTTKSIYKSVFMYTLLFTILLCALIALFLINAQATQLQEHEDVHIDSQKNYSYEQVLQKGTMDILFNYCSKLNYLNYSWKSYVLCLPYFESYQQKFLFMMLLSLLIVAINYILSLIIYALGDFRRYKTKADKRKFIIIYTFIVYFVNNGLLILLIRADFDGYSLSKIIQNILPNNIGRFNIQSYKDFNRKWYLHIGSQIILNYGVSMVISPFLQIGFGWILMKYRFWIAKSAKTQKQMNETVADTEFDFESFYAMILNSIFFCLFYSNAIPLLYPLTILSLLSLYIASVIIFKYFSCKQVTFDSSLNADISKIITMGILVHQLTSILYFYVQQIFPSDGDHNNNILHKFKEGSLYLILSILILIFLYYHDSICRLAKLYWNQSYKQQKDKKSKNKLFSQVFLQQDSSNYLSSYKMEDNPLYQNLCSATQLIKLYLNKFLQRHIIQELQDNDHPQSRILQRNQQNICMPTAERIID